MSQVVVSRNRTGWDIAIGALLIIAGLVIFGDVAVATKVSILFLGWMILISGLLALVSAVVNQKRGGFWSSAIAGGVLTVIGLMFLRHTHAAALTLTLIAGALFLTTGIIRLLAGFVVEEYRWPLLIGGAVSTVLGLVVLLNLIDASYALIGILLGIQVLTEGIALILVGRVTVRLMGSDPAL